MNKELVVLKLGGSGLLDPTILEEVFCTIQGYIQYQYAVVLVHGGGPVINSELTRLGISWEFIQGQRKTTPQMMQVIERVLFQEINQDLVRKLRDFGIPAMGLSGGQEQLLFCEQACAELERVGAIQQVNSERIRRCLTAAVPSVPVIAPIGVDANGELYNINADWAAVKIATALGASKLIFLTDQEGILDENKTVISFADPKLLRSLLVSGQVNGGMMTKVNTVLEALACGVKQVRILHGQQAKLGLWSDQVGTFCGVQP